MKLQNKTALITGPSRGIPAAAYASSKAVIRSHTKSVALYAAKKDYNIRYHSLHPGSILTPLWDDMLSDDPATRQQRINMGASGIALGRMGQAEDLATMALFLASDDSKYITNTEFNINGSILSGSQSASQKAAPQKAQRFKMRLEDDLPKTPPTVSHAMFKKLIGLILSLSSLTLHPTLTPDPDFLSEDGAKLIRYTESFAAFPYDVQKSSPGFAYKCRLFDIKRLGQPDYDITLGWGHKILPADFDEEGILSTLGITQNRFFNPQGEALQDPDLLSAAEGEALFQQDILKRAHYSNRQDLFQREEHYQSLADYKKTGKKATSVNVFDSLETREKDAIVSFTYNVGLRGLQRSDVYQGLMTNDMDYTLEGFSHFHKAGGRVSQGLIKRRFIELGVYTGKSMPPTNACLPSTFYKFNYDERPSTLPTLRRVSDDMWQHLEPPYQQEVSRVVTMYENSQWPEPQILKLK